MADRTFKLKFLADVQQAIGQIDKLGDKVGNMSGKTKAVAAAAAVGGVAIGAAAVAGFKSAITLAADYEHAIDAVATVAKASAEQEKQLYDKGRQIGRRTAFTALESAAAMEELAAQGLTVDQIINGAADATVNLAAAGGTDLVTAATGIAGTMDVWKLGAADMVDVVNRIAGAANVSKFGVADMNLAIGQGAGVAKAAGVSYQDFLATIAASASSFSSGSDAGTGAKTFFQTIIGRSGPARKAMKEFGLITKDNQNLFYDAKGDFLGMANAADVLNESFAGLSDFERTEGLQKIFGSDASRTAAALMEKGRPGFESISQGMADNDAAAQATRRLGNLKASLDQLKGSLEDIGIGLGEKFLAPLAKVAMFLADWLPKIPTGVILAVGAFALFIGMLSALSLAIAPILLLLTTLGIGIGGVALAFGAIPLAIAAVIAAGYLLFTHWDELTARAAGVRDAVLSTVGLGEGKPGNKPAQVGANAATQGAIAAIPVLGTIYSGVRGAKSLQNLVPRFASGGMVPGSGPQLAIVHGGEQVLTRAQQQGGVNVFVTVEGSIHSDAGLARTIAQMLGDQMQRGALGLR